MHRDPCREKVFDLAHVALLTERVNHFCSNTFLGTVADSKAVPVVVDVDVGVGEVKHWLTPQQSMYNVVHCEEE